MIKHSLCLYNGEYIGIESIFTVKDGKQINIPGKIEQLRALGREGKLFCACGCGARLSLVASDRKIRQQHFRFWKGEEQAECRAVEEEQKSIWSKVALKHWLKAKLGIEEIECRVPVDDVSDVDRKYQLSLLAREQNVAVCYWYNRANLEDKKFEVLENNNADIRVIYVVDSMNEQKSEQYPEWTMKIQNQQEYCLFLYAEEEEYDCVQMKAVAYMQNEDGLWKEVYIAKGLLKDYDIYNGGDLSFRGTKLSELTVEKKSSFNKLVEQEIEKRRKREERQKLKEKKAMEELELIVAKQKELAETVEERVAEYREKQRRKSKDSGEEIEKGRKAIMKEDKKMSTDDPDSRYMICPLCNSGLVKGFVRGRRRIKCSNPECMFEN